MLKTWAIFKPRTLGEESSIETKFVKHFETFSFIFF